MSKAQTLTNYIYSFNDLISIYIKKFMDLKKLNEDTSFISRSFRNVNYPYISKLVKLSKYVGIENNGLSNRIYAYVIYEKAIKSFRYFYYMNLIDY